MWLLGRGTGLKQLLHLKSCNSLLPCGLVASPLTVMHYLAYETSLTSFFILAHCDAVLYVCSPGIVSLMAWVFLQLNNICRLALGESVSRARPDICHLKPS